VPDGADDDALAAHSVENDIRSAANDQFANSGFASGATQGGVVSQNFNYGNNPGSQSLRRLRLVF